MNANRIWTATCAAVLALSLIAGCKRAATDNATLNTQVQSRLFSDQNLRGESIQTAVSGGVATLTGTVSSDDARTTAGGDAAQVAGIRTVVNNLVVQAPVQPAVAAVAPSAPAAAQRAPILIEKPTKPSPSIAPHGSPQPAPIVRNIGPWLGGGGSAMDQAQAAPPPMPQAPPPPQPPVAHNITLPSGTAIPVRITQTLDSATTQTGDKFTGSIASDIIVDDFVVLAQGTPVTGHVDEAKDAAHFKGSSLLTISLSSISHRGERIDVSTEQFSKEGAGRGKNTAEKTGGGAAVGAILGGILGGGKGAAIGAAAGGGIGAGANGVTRGQQVQIPSETVIRFHLSDPIIVHVNPGGAGPREDSNPGPTLERHTDQ